MSEHTDILIPLPTETTVCDLAKTWYGDRLVAPPSPEAGDAALEDHKRSREQCIGAVALLWGLDQGDEYQKGILDRKVKRLEQLGSGLENVEVDQRPIVVETAEDVVFLTLSRAGYDHKVEKLAFHDRLTGAKNRNGEDIIVDSWINPKGHGRRSTDTIPNQKAVLEIDMANFKRINDMLGPIIGDLVLVEAVRELEELIRPGDEIVRPGGDDFRVYIHEILDEGLASLLERIKGVQNAKVADGKNQSAWLRIQVFMGLLKGRGEVAQASVQLSDPEDRTSERMLCINGHPIIPLRSIIVYAVGGSSGAVENIEQIETLWEDALQGMKDHKELLHEEMGGADRTHEVEVVVNTDAERDELILEKLSSDGDTIKVVRLDLTEEALIRPEIDVRRDVL